MTSRDRWIQATAATALITALVGGTAGYGLRFRTDTYRRDLEQRLSLFFQLPTEVGRVEPHTLHSRVFRDVRIWLPDRRDRVFDCPLAIWTQAPGGRASGLQLDLVGGTLSIGSEQWLPEDYRRVLRAAFTRNLADLDLRLVRFQGVDFAWPRRGARLTAEHVTGQVVFDGQRRGEAMLVASSLNGVRVAEPVHIFALVRPEEDDFLPEVRLTVPKLPIATLQLDQPLRAPVHSGRFEGTIVYRQHGEAETVHVSGRAEGLALRELTAGAPFGPIDGWLQLRIEDSTIAGSPPVLESIRLSGQLDDLAIGPLLQRAGYRGVDGRAAVRIDQLHLQGSQVRELSAGGRLGGVSLEPLTGALGRGVIRGDLSVLLNSLRITDDQIATLDADLQVRPPRNSPGTIDREMLLNTFTRLIGVSLPEQILPEKIEYAQIGAKLLANRGRLRVLGRVGPHGRAILVLRLLGQEVPVPPPTETFSIQPVLDDMQLRLRRLNRETIRRWWWSPPPSQPASRTS